MRMFALPVLLQQSGSLAPAGLDLLMTFASGVIIDAITPARAITVDAVTPVVRSTQRSGSTQGSTSLVFNGLGSSGLVISDMTNVLTGIGNPTDNDYTIEFWAQLGDNSYTLKIGATGSDVFSFSLAGNSITLQDTGFTTATLNNALVNKRGWLHVAIVRRKVTGSYFGDLYYNGTLVETKTLVGFSRTPTSIQLYVNSPSTTINPETALNFFALTRALKYSANFNPLTDTGLNPYFAPLSTGYCIGATPTRAPLSPLTPHLLLTFNNGVATDEITPLRVVTLGSNRYIRSPYGAGSYRARTSLVGDRTVSTGLVISDVSGLFLASDNNFVVEFWALQQANSSTNNIKLVASGGNIMSHAMDGNSGTIQGTSIPTGISSEFSRPLIRKWIHYAYQRRTVFGSQYADFYVDGVLRLTTICTDVPRTLTSIVLFDNGNAGDTPESALNYFAFTRGTKYNQTFNPDTDTNLNSYFLTPTTGYCT